MATYIFGESPVMREIERKIGAISRTGVPVLIEGETGTGKEALARHLHAITPHSKGFTRFVCAAGGTGPRLEEDAGMDGWIFFKYVDRLDVAGQEQLHATLDRRAGGNWQRVVSSSSQQLDLLVAQKRFSESLYHHLAGARLKMPALRDRQADIPGLFEVLVSEIAGQTGVAAPPVSYELVAALMSHTWPGNFLELYNLAAMFAVSADESEIIEELMRRSESRQPTVAPRLPLKEQLRKAARELESGIILRTLENHRWNRRRTAETLNISYRSLLYKMKACNLRGENSGGEVCK